MQRTWVAVGQEAADLENQLVHEWRVTRLSGLGIPRPMADAAADHVDWHQIARLVRRGCLPTLALRIVSLGPGQGTSLGPGQGVRRWPGPGSYARVGGVAWLAGSGAGSVPDRFWRLTRIMASAMMAASARMPAETR